MPSEDHPAISNNCSSGFDFLGLISKSAGVISQFGLVVVLKFQFNADAPCTPFKQAKLPTANCLLSLWLTRLTKELSFSGPILIR